MVLESYLSNVSYRSFVLFQLNCHGQTILVRAKILFSQLRRPPLGACEADCEQVLGGGLPPHTREVGRRLQNAAVPCESRQRISRSF